MNIRESFAGSQLHLSPHLTLFRVITPKQGCATRLQASTDTNQPH